MPDSSDASRSAAATMSGSPSSQCPPSCSQRPNRGCSVSRACVPVWSSTSAEAVIWPGTHSLLHASSRASTNDSTACRSVSCAGSGAAHDVSASIVESRRRHLRTSRPSVGAGSRGSGRLGRVADRDGAQRFPVVGQIELGPDQVRGEDRRADPAAADPAHGQCDEKRLNGRPDRDGEHGVLGGGARRVRVAVRTVGNEERDHQFGCVVEDLAAADPALDGVGRLAVAAEVGSPLVLHPVQQPDPGRGVGHPHEPHRPGVVRGGRRQRF